MTAPFRQLCFTVMAPYGSWGAASQPSATTAWKATELDPPKSAILGLLGAALGLERDRLGPLSEAVRIAVRTGLRPTRDPRPDYHTVGRARRPPDRDRWSRFEELRTALSGRDHAGSLLSAREYWSCGLWSVALAATADDAGDDAGNDAAAPLLDRLETALRAPRWPLYAGRKACTLGLPPDPEILVAAGPAAALGEYRWPWERHTGLRSALAPLIRWKDERGDVESLAWDEDYPGAPSPAGGTVVQRVWRRDRPDPLLLPGGRIHQRFQDRTELRTAFPSTAAPAGDA